MGFILWNYLESDFITKALIVCLLVMRLSVSCENGLFANSYFHDIGGTKIPELSEHFLEATVHRK